MNVENIILYNHFHIGDVYLSYGLVKHIVKSNPGKNIVYVMPRGQALLSNIDGLKTDSFSCSVPIIPHTILPYKCYELSKDISYQKLDDTTVAINLWIGGISTEKTRLIEANFTLMQEEFIKQLHKLNESYGANIQYLKPESWEELIPVLPTLCINKFENWQQSNKKSSILYFNYEPKSFQDIGVKNHDDVLIALSDSFPDVNIFVPKASAHILSLNRNNIIDCSTQFDCEFDDKGFNLLKLAQIGESCRIVVTFDVGAAFLYANARLLTTNNIVIAANVSCNRYYNLLRQNFKVSDETYSKHVIPMESGCGFSERLVEFIKHQI
jgi:hypothetical protein